jgi:hypothetical protein
VIVDQVNGMLIVLKLYALPLYVLFNIFLLFNLEHLLIEYLLQFLICVVDTKLLEGI